MGFISQLFRKPPKDEAFGASKPAATEPPLAAPPVNSHYQDLKLQGSGLLDSGNLAEAAKAYELALQACPSLSEAHLNLGYVYQELQRKGEARSLFEQALALDPGNFDAHLLLAMQATDEGDLEAALSSARSVIRLRPESTEGRACCYKVLALQRDFGALEALARELAAPDLDEAQILMDVAAAFANVATEGALKGELTQLALQQLRQAARTDPGCVKAYISMGMLLMTESQFDEAIALYRQAIKVKPDSADGYYCMGLCYKSLGDLEATISNVKKALEIDPEHIDAVNMLGRLYIQEGLIGEALSLYKNSIDIPGNAKNGRMQLANTYFAGMMFELAFGVCIQLVEEYPNDHIVHFLLGNIYNAQQNFPKAIESFETVLRLQPSYGDARINMAGAYLGMGDMASALAQWQSFSPSSPQHLIALHNIVYCQSFDPRCSPAEYLAHARQFGHAAAAKARPFQSWKRMPLSNRALKVGLVSPDFCLHPVGYFLESILSQLDTEKVEFHAFSALVRNDPLQASLKARMSSWSSIAGLDDAAAAKLIHDAELDLLIDLAGHTANSRLGLFAWRPAPVQASWLGFWGSTGVAEIDYILVDQQSVPDSHKSHFLETPWYLPQTRLCFTPPTLLYEHLPSPPPALKNGFCTFGCFQPVRKMSEAVLQAWGRILAQVPDARLRLQGAKFTEPKISADILRRLADVGIPAHRVSLHTNAPRIEYMMAHAEVDMVLDTFPYPGGTTSCDALWMGVPTVTLAGANMLGRQGASLMTCAGLPDWVAQTEDEYVTIAVAKARDVAALAALRSRLRAQVFDTPLFNAPLFTRNLEANLLAMVNDKLGPEAG